MVLDLTPEQRSEVLRLRQSMLAREANLVEQRRRLNLQIKVLVLLYHCLHPSCCIALASRTSIGTG